jgi:hypothetical protein
VVVILYATVDASSSLLQFSLHWPPLEIREKRAENQRWPGSDAAKVGAGGWVQKKKKGKANVPAALVIVFTILTVLLICFTKGNMYSRKYVDVH